MPPPTVAGAHGDRGRVHRESGVGWLRLRGEDTSQQAEARESDPMEGGTTHGSTLLSPLYTQVLSLHLLPCQSAAPSRTRMWSKTTRMAYGLPSCAFAAAATWSGSKPNFLWSSLSGADAPNVCMPIMRPARPT